MTFLVSSASNFVLSQLRLVCSGITDLKQRLFFRESGKLIKWRWFLGYTLLWDTSVASGVSDYYFTKYLEYFYIILLIVWIILLFHWYFVFVLLYYFTNNATM